MNGKSTPGPEKRYIGGFESGERVRIQDTAAKGKQWKHIGTIREQTPGKDSFIIEMDNGEVIRRHKRFISVEKGEDDSESTKEGNENADQDCTLRASTGLEEKEEIPMKTWSTHGRINPVHIDEAEDEVSK